MEGIHSISGPCPQYARNNFTNLPDELCARIFSYLHPIQHQLPLIALVCQKWRQILQSTGSLWRSIHIDPTDYDYWHFSLIDTLFRIYGRHVQTLTWKETAPVYESLFALIPQLRNLRCLRLPVLWTQKIIESLSSLTQLEQIHVNGGFTITDTELEQICEYFPNLRLISLNACWSVTAEGVHAMLQRLPHLHTVNLKINSGLRLNDMRSERAMQEGGRIALSLANSDFAHLLSVLCLHFVPIEMDELWEMVDKLPGLRRLSISNCEHLHGIRLVSSSLQKIYLFNMWSVLFVSITAANLRHVTIDHGMESMEHLEIFAPRLRRLQVDGCKVLRTINIRSERLAILELNNCDELDMRSLRHTLTNNPSLLSLKLGRIREENLAIDETTCPSIQELCLLGEFGCRTVYVRSPTLRLIHTEADTDLIPFNHMYIVANHLCKVALAGVPNLRSMVIQCCSVDSIELNLCSDDQVCLESCVIQAFSAIGFLRLFDCKVNMFSVSTPLAKTIVLYRCCLPDYVLQMALAGCPNISHLNLEKSREFSHVNIQAPPMKYLNLFGCHDVMEVDVDCPELVAVNLGQCPNVHFYLKGAELNMTTSEKPKFVLPHESYRWSHDYPPEVYYCS
ncbi:uncharacterized protein LOC135485499 [Lineus longissimus]|uniref:uncharacterized protein LOC135485499 n=1 Tax=Lineus longissimus TaxID=88925 RepID=UPI002B4D595D